MMDFCNKCIELSDFDSINNLFSYMITKREETAIKDVVEKKIMDHITNGSTTGSENLDLLIKYGANNRSSLPELVNKYIECVPELSQRIKGIESRKEKLYTDLQAYTEKWPAEGKNIYTKDDLEAMKINKDMLDERIVDFMMKEINGKNLKKEFGLKQFYEYALTGDKDVGSIKERKSFDEILNMYYTIKEGESTFKSYEDLAYDTPDLLKWRLYTNDRFSLERREEAQKNRIKRRQGLLTPKHNGYF